MHQLKHLHHPSPQHQHSSAFNDLSFSSISSMPSTLKFNQPLIQAQIGGRCKSVFLANAINQQLRLQQVEQYVVAIENKGCLNALGLPACNGLSIEAIARTHGSIQGEILSKRQFKKIFESCKQAYQLHTLKKTKTLALEFFTAHSKQDYQTLILDLHAKSASIGVFFNMNYPPRKGQSSIKTEHCDEFYEHIALVKHASTKHIELAHFGQVFYENYDRLWQSCQNLATHRQAEFYIKNPQFWRKQAHLSSNYVAQYKQAFLDLSLFHQPQLNLFKSHIAVKSPTLEVLENVQISKHNPNDTGFKASIVAVYT